jgi:predicted RNA-binding Zn-ribbon protein involved in translation (DUF1610 family)
MPDYTTIRLKKTDYDQLLEAKKRLDKQIGENTSISAAIGFLAGLFGGITFAALLANSIKKSQFHKCSCGQIIDLTDWAGRAFQCPSCGTGWEQMAPRQEPTR